MKYFWRVKRFGSILLLSLYMFSMVHTLVPVMSFYMNHEYIKTHLCRSLTQPEFSDCDGFCFLKKQIDEHHHHHDSHDHGSAVYVPKMPFLYLPEIHPAFSNSLMNSERDIGSHHDDRLPDQIYLDIISPPPQG